MKSNYGRDLASFLITCTVGLLAGCAAVASDAAAQVVTEWVTIGDAGNLEHTVPKTDRTVGYGAVDYEYRLGKYEVTNAEYAEFLNAVAVTDPNALYNTAMQNFVFGGITRNGSSGNYNYALRPNMGNKPVNFVTFFDAARYTNWLHNGQPTGIQNALTTEDGAYTFTDVEEVSARNSGALVYLPNEHEYHKAAFYEPGAVTDDGDEWWYYSTRSDDQPVQALANAVGDISNPGPNVASYSKATNWNGTTGGNLVSVGTSGSQSYYGAQDLGGSVFEWVEADLSKPDPFEAGPYQVRGGSYFSTHGHQRSYERNNGPRAGDGDTDGADFLVWQRGLGQIDDQASFFTDFNLDGIVDGGDLAIWQSAFGLTDAGDADLDVGHAHNHPGKAVGFRVAAVALPASLGVVPEPSTIFLCGLAAVAVTCRRPTRPRLTSP